MLDLNKYRSNVTSQNGEDGVLDEIFKRIGINNQWCCEFGAWDGKVFSNTYNLVQKGWNAVLIESDLSKFLDLVANTKDNPRVIPINSKVEYLGSNTLDKILRKNNVPLDFDLLSIDIDNDDYLVWRFLKYFTPRVVVIEVNSSYPPYIEATPGVTGASIKSMVTLGKRKGYELVLHTGNAIFVRKEYTDKLDTFPIWQDLFDSNWLV